MTLLKKIDPEWYPSENKNLKVGETIEITDPRDLIINGTAVALRPDGTEVSAYEMYGVLTSKDKSELEDFLAFKRQKQVQEKLEKEQASLKEQLEKVEEKEEVKEESVVAPAPVVLEELRVPSEAEVADKRVAALAKARAAKAAKAGK